MELSTPVPNGARCNPKTRRLSWTLHSIFIKALEDDLLGPGFMRVTTALPDDNALFVKTLRELL